MKNLIFFVTALLCLLQTQNTFAQDATDSNTLHLKNTLSYTQNMDSIYANLSKQYITSGILYNRVLPLANLPTITDSTKMSEALFIQAYYELYLSTYNNQDLPTVNKTSLLTAYYKQYDTLLLGIINCKYHKLKDTIILGDMLVMKDGKYYDGTNVKTAFEQKQITVATLLTTELEVDKDYVINLGKVVLENNSNKIKSVTIEMKKTRGGNPIFMNSNIHFSVHDIGEYELNIRIELLDGSIFEYKQPITVKNVLNRRSSLTGINCEIKPYTPLLPNIADPFGIIKASLPFNNINGQAIINVFYRTNGQSINSLCPTTIQKPIILLDGIDDQAKHSAQWMYDNKLVYINPNNPTDILQIGDSLRLMGYDVIMFNPIIYQNGNDLIDGGDDFIERNAFILIQLINDLKNDMQLQGITPEIVIAGPSMGGQVSRFALAYMEQQLAITGNTIWEHHCRLWASLDSPHDGANIPIGLQQFIKYLAQFSADAKLTYDGSLRAPASRQQLIHQSNDGTWDMYDLFMSNTCPERIGWMNTLNTFGYPNDCRKVAIANGSSQGGYYHTPNDYMLNLEVGSSQDAKFILRSRFLNTFNNGGPTLEAYFRRLWQVSLNLDPTFLYLQGNGLFINTYWDMPLLSGQTFNNSIYSAIDACPGSFYDVQDVVAGGIIGAIDSLPQRVSGVINGVVKWPVYTHNISFIPTVSALGFTNPNFDWSTPIPDGLICKNLIPFDNYYVPKENQDHVSFTQESWRWLKEELEKGHKDPACLPQICGLTKINGSVNICMNSSFQYHLNMAIPAGYTYNWVVSNNITKSNETNSSVTVNTTIAGDAWIRLIITNPCGANWVIEKNITIQPNPIATVPSFTVTPNSGCKNMVDIDFTSYPYQSMSWLVHWGSTSAAFTTNGTTLTTSHIVNCGSPKNVEALVTASNTCGISNILYTCNVQCDGTFNVTFRKKNIKSELYNFQIYPNPADINWVLSIKNKEIKDVIINLTDINGKLVYTKNYNNLSADNLIIPCENLSKGMYILNVVYAEKVEKFKLIKE